MADGDAVAQCHPGGETGEADGDAVGDGVMAAALLWKHRVSWGRFETAVLTLVLGCLVVWNISGPRGVTIAGTVAICVAGLPRPRDIIRD